MEKVTPVSFLVFIILAECIVNETEPLFAAPDDCRGFCYWNVKHRGLLCDSQFLLAMQIGEYARNLPLVESQ